MKTIKQISSPNGTVTLSEINNQYVTSVVKGERTLNNKPTKDLKSALNLFDHFVSQIGKENDRIN